MDADRFKEAIKYVSGLGENLAGSVPGLRVVLANHGGGVDPHIVVPVGKKNVILKREPWPTGGWAYSASNARMADHR